MTIDRSKLVKYPRTLHLPWSDGITNDDKVLKNVDHFKGKEVVVTEKYDGENFTMYNDHCHARSVDGRYHPSRSWVQNLWGEIHHRIGEDQRICGENLFWVHSIIYTDLPSYFLMFSFWEEDVCFSWDATLKIAEELKLHTVKELYRGVFDEEKIKQIFTDDMKKNHEGYVVRLADSFKLEDFNKSVAKYVRENHVQTDQHWMRTGGELNMLKIKKQ